MKSHPNKHWLTREPKKIGIIGAGAAGIIYGKTLHQQGYDVQIYDKQDKIGGVWSANYDNLHVQFPHDHYAIPDFPWPKDYPIMPAKEQCVTHFTNYTKEYGINDKIHLNTGVKEIVQNPDESWTVSFDNRDPETFDLLVMATGTFSEPNIPTWPGMDKFKGHMCHSQKLRDYPKNIKDKEVVIIGGGKSAQDICKWSVAEGAKNVTMVARRATWTISIEKENFLFGFIPMPLFIFSRISERFKIPPSWQPDLEKWQDGFIGRRLSKMVNRVLDKYQSKGLPPQLDPAPRSLLDDLQSNGVARDMRFVNAIKDGKAKLLKGHSVKEITEDGVITTKGEFVKADTIVAATGLTASIKSIKSNHSFTVEKDGFWLYRGCIQPGATNLFFAGHALAIFMLSAYNIHAVWLTEVLRGKVELPSHKEMQEERDARRELHRRQMSIPTFVSAHLNSTIPLIDKMIQEMGLNHRRKRNLFSEWFLPYDNDNWRSIITHHV